MQVERKHPSGAWEVCDLIAGTLQRRTYYDYTREEAIEAFRDDVGGGYKITYWRHPTPGEIKFGQGSIHYREFTLVECSKPKTLTPRKWFVADDGLRYNY